MSNVVIAIVEGKRTITLLEKVREGKKHNLYITDDVIPAGKNYSFCTMQGKVVGEEFIDNTGNSFPIVETGTSFEEVAAKVAAKAEEAKEEKETKKREKKPIISNKKKRSQEEKAEAAASEAAANN